MSLSADEMIKVMEKAKELGVNELKVEGMSLSFAEAMRSAGFKSSEPVPELKAEEIVKPLSAFDDLTEEEIMYYATPRYDEIQAEKAAHQEKLKEEGRA
jgi:hypothetical protein